MLLLLLLALFGHLLLWVALFNRLHALGTPRPLTRALSLLCLVGLLAIPPGLVVVLARGGFSFFPADGWTHIPWPIRPYLAVCWMAVPVTVFPWLWHVGLRREPRVLRAHRSQIVAMTPPPASEEHAQHFLVRAPRNQTFSLDRSERTIDIPRLPPALDGLSIVHISDFHFTGRVGKAYFHEVVRHSNEVQPDLIAVTGDLVDKKACIEWAPEILGELRARYGVYFILGNHDVRAGAEQVRSRLAETGLIDLGGRWVQTWIREQPVILAGNELPWIAPAADLRSHPPHAGGARPLRIALSHSPDQLAWARSHDVDLLLAGHTHGGQIRFPLIGAVVSPCREGVRYASGLFHAPPTVMHVTRGVSGELPIRLNCPPEMAHLILRAVSAADGTA